MRRLSVSEFQQELCEEVGVKLSTETVRRWCKSGKLPAIQVGAKFFIEVESNVFDLFGKECDASQ